MTMFLKNFVIALCVCIGLRDVIVCANDQCQCNCGCGPKIRIRKPSKSAGMIPDRPTPHMTTMAPVPTPTSLSPTTMGEIVCTEPFIRVDDCCFYVFEPASTDTRYTKEQSQDNCDEIGGQLIIFETNDKVDKFYGYLLTVVPNDDGTISSRNLHISGYRVDGAGPWITDSGDPYPNAENLPFESSPPSDAACMTAINTSPEVVGVSPSICDNPAYTAMVWGCEMK